MARFNQFCLGRNRRPRGRRADKHGDAVREARVELGEVAARHPNLGSLYDSQGRSDLRRILAAEKFIDNGESPENLNDARATPYGVTANGLRWAFRMITR